MKKSTTEAQVIPFDSDKGFEDELTAVLKKGTQRMLRLGEAG